MLKILVKAARAHQLYLHNNPTYLRALEMARAAFAPIWRETDELVFDVTETELGGTARRCCTSRRRRRTTSRG